MPPGSLFPASPSPARGPCHEPDPHPAPPLPPRPARHPRGPGAPDVEVAARHLRIGDDYAATLAVTGYPAEVAPGWLEPLLSYPGRLDVALHIDPVPPAAAADRLPRPAGPAGIGAPRRRGPRPARRPGH